MAKQRLSISAKMMLASVILIGFIVGGFGVLAVQNTRAVIDRESLDKIAVFQDGLERFGEAGTTLFARAVEQLVVDRGRDKDILALVHDVMANRAVSDDTTVRGDYLVRMAMVLDPNQNVVAHCVAGAQVRCVDGSHQAVNQAAGPLATEAWQAVIAHWEGGGALLARVDVTRGDASYRVFALPVFVGEVGTAAAAAAETASPGRQGYVLFAYDLTPIAEFAMWAAANKQIQSRKVMAYTAILGLLFLVAGSAIAIWQSLRISRPIVALARKADLIARGDLAARVRVTSSDEIGKLAESFNFMAEQIVTLLAQATERARLDQEVELVKTIYEALVPPPNLVVQGQVQLIGALQPATQAGGDWWTWYELPDGRIALVIGDVTGHGVPSAMVTAAAKAACDVALAVYRNEVTVTTLLEIMNYAVFESTQRKLLMTCFAAIIDVPAQTVTYANAGHNFPYMVRPDGHFAALSTSGNCLGDVRASRYEARAQGFALGTTFVFFTDGLIECMNTAGEPYGERRLRALLKQHLPGNVAAIHTAVLKDVDAFMGGEAKPDDVTLIVARVG